MTARPLHTPRHRRTPLALALSLIFAAVMPAARAATIQVTTPDDPTGSPSTCTLRQAIAAMNAQSIGSGSGCLNSGAAFGTSDTITFAAAVTSVALADVPGNELLISAADLTIQGSGTGGVNVSRVSGATNKFRLLHDRGGNLSLSGLTLSNGATVASSAAGGAIFMDIAGATTLQLTDCIVSGNSTAGAGAVGGAIAVGDLYSSGGIARVIGSNVSGNATLNNNAPGGAIYATSQAYLLNSTVSGNSTAGKSSPGGGIWALNTKLHYSTLDGNATGGDDSGGGAVAGNAIVGGVSAYHSTLSGNITTGYKSPGGATDTAYAQNFEYALVTGNSTSGNLSDGGGIYAKKIFFSNSVISNNTTSGSGSNGGGVFVHTTVAASSTVQTSTISGNQASGTGSSGGGLWMLTGRLIESTVSGNAANVGGAGIHLNVCQSAEPALSAYNSTIAFNTTTVAGGAGIYFASSGCAVFGGGSTQTNATAKLTSTIAADTIVESAASADFAAAPGFLLTLDTDHDLIQRPSTNPDITTVNAAGSPAVINLDPKLVVLADNGCGARSGAPESAVCVTLHAIACSPALNTGSNLHGDTDDERGSGYPRENSSLETDIGAFQLQPGFGDELFCDGFDGIE